MIKPDYLMMIPGQQEYQRNHSFSTWVNSIPFMALASMREASYSVSIPTENFLLIKLSLEPAHCHQLIS